MPKRVRSILPNLITVSRLVCVPVVVGLMLAGAMAPAFWLFLGAAASDALDGALARWLHAQSIVGSYLDALADKVLLVSVYLYLGGTGLMTGWLVGLVVGRDLLLVSGTAVMAMAGRRNGVRPLSLSKVNTAAQIVLAAMILGHEGLGWFPEEARQPLSGVVAATTLGSGLAYLRAWLGQQGDRSAGVEKQGRGGDQGKQGCH